MAGGFGRLFKSLKTALLAFVGCYIGYFLYAIVWLVWGPGKSAEVPPLFLWAIVPGVIGAVIAFVVCFYLTGREIEAPTSLTK